MDQLPVTVKRSLELLGLCLLLGLFYMANSIIMPLLMAFFISLMLLPLFRFLRKIRIPEIIAIVLVILTGALIIIAILLFFSLQVASLVKDISQLEKNLNLHWNTLSAWINRNLNLSADQQIRVLQEQGGKLLNNAGSYLSGAAVSITEVFVFVGLLPIYVFLILFYKNLLLRFIFLWFKKEDHPQVESALRETEVMVKSYLTGLMIQVTYMTILLGVLLTIVGIKHAMLIAIVFAILNLIPYVGALIGNLFGVLLTLSSSSELWHVFAVLIVIAVVQFLDNNILMPKIVGSKVKINALVTIIGVIVGGSLAGISGMFLSLPIIAVLKIIFDHTEAFKHWGLILGDERPGLSPMTNPIVRLRNRHVRTPDDDDGEEEGG
ncbi:MAG: AI-2E family transporter [Chitinophagaceae bacterium]|nr:AI-2E family transporter [Chitinophagaceae bacterium]